MPAAGTTLSSHTLLFTSANPAVGPIKKSASYRTCSLDNSSAGGFLRTTTGNARTDTRLPRRPIVPVRPLSAKRAAFFIRSWCAGSICRIVSPHFLFPGDYRSAPVSWPKRFARGTAGRCSLGVCPKRKSTPEAIGTDRSPAPQYAGHFRAAPPPGHFVTGRFLQRLSCRIELHVRERHVQRRRRRPSRGLIKPLPAGNPASGPITKGRERTRGRILP